MQLWGGPVRTSPLTPQSAGVSLNPHAQARKPGENEWKFARKREGKQGNTHPPCTRRVTSPCAATSRLNLCGAATPFNNRRSRLGLRVRGESPPPVSKGPIRRQRGGVSGGPAPGPPPEHATCARLSQRGRRALRQLSRDLPGRASLFTERPCGVSQSLSSHLTCRRQQQSVLLVPTG